MIYRTTLLQFLSFAGGLLTLALILRLFRRPKASSRILLGLAGACLGFLITPPIAVATDLLPRMWIELRYFREPFLGCISPIGGFMALFYMHVGVLHSFAAGCWFGPKLCGAVASSEKPTRKPADAGFLIVPWLAGPFVALLVSEGPGETISNNLQSLGLPVVSPIVRAWGAVGICFLLGAFTWAFQKERFAGHEGAELTRKVIKRGAIVSFIQFVLVCIAGALCWLWYQSL